MTEAIQDNNSPEFVTQIEVDFFFEENQKFIIRLYDVDDFKDVKNLEKHDFIGDHEFSLHKLVSSRNQVYSA